MSDQVHFGVWVRMLRMQRALSQEALAERVGCAAQTIRTFEEQNRRPSRTLAERLADSLDVPPDDRAQFLQLALAPQAGLPDSAPEPRSNSLRLAPPAPAIDLIGRAGECAALLQHLRTPGQRLISLVGPGGIGKTSVALQVAADMAQTNDALFGDGVAVVFLAAVGSAGNVALAVADSIGLLLQGARAVADQLIEALRARALLLVLDNLEHLLASAEGSMLTGLIQRLLAEVPGLRILAVSRERLRLRSEHVIELRGLGLPPSDLSRQVERSDAVRLFVERAQQSMPEFALDASNRAVVARICRQLGGIPLAIELAAAWIRTLTPREIAAEIERSIDFLTHTDRDVPARHSSMRAVLDHSWRLLSDAERDLLAYLSVFRGGADREAIEAVYGAAGAARGRGPVLPLLAALIDKSLLRREDVQGFTRYTLHELVRQYAAEHLAALPDAQAQAEAQHRGYYAALLQRLIQAQTGRSTLADREQLDREHENLRVAWARAAAAGDTAILVAMTRGLHMMYEAHSWLLDGAQMFGSAADVLQPLGEPALAARVQLLGLQGYFLLRAGRFVEAGTPLEQALALLQYVGISGRNSQYYYLGIREFRRAMFDRAFDYFRQAIDLSLAAGDDFVRRWVNYFVGIMRMARGEYDEAEQLFRSNAREWRQVGGYARAESLNLAELGETLGLLGRYDEAAVVVRESLRVAGPARDSFVIGICLRQLGVLAQSQGDLEEARYLLAESLETLRAIGDPWDWSRTALRLLLVDLALGDAASARRALSDLSQASSRMPAALVSSALFGAAALMAHTGQAQEALALLLALEHGEYLIEQQVREYAARLRAEVEPALAPDQQAAALQQSRRDPQMWLAEILSRPLGPHMPDARPYEAQLGAPVAPPAPAPPPIVALGSLHIPDTGETLSPREIEVLRLLIVGASNPLIASTLMISIFTVKHHVASILHKLDVGTRTQAALRGRELGLEPFPL